MEPCHRCDRDPCPTWLVMCATFPNNAPGTCCQTCEPMRVAIKACRMHAVDWRSRCLAAEAEVERLSSAAAHDAEDCRKWQAEVDVLREQKGRIERAFDAMRAENERLRRLADATAALDLTPESRSALHAIDLMMRDTYQEAMAEQAAEIERLRAHRNLMEGATIAELGRQRDECNQTVDGAEAEAEALRAHVATLQARLDAGLAEAGRWDGLYAAEAIARALRGEP